MNARTLVRRIVATRRACICAVVRLASQRQCWELASEVQQVDNIEFFGRYSNDQPTRPYLCPCTVQHLTSISRESNQRIKILTSLATTAVEVVDFSFGYLNGATTRIRMGPRSIMSEVQYAAFPTTMLFPVSSRRTHLHLSFRRAVFER